MGPITRQQEWLLASLTIFSSISSILSSSIILFHLLTVISKWWSWFVINILQKWKNNKYSTKRRQEQRQQQQKQQQQQQQEQQSSTNNTTTVHGEQDGTLQDNKNNFEEEDNKNNIIVTIPPTETTNDECHEGTNTATSINNTSTKIQQQQQQERRQSRRSSINVRRSSTTEHVLHPTYTRIVTYMSCFDIMYSINLCFQPFSTDKTSSHFSLQAPWSSTVSCNITAIVHQLGYAGAFYYIMLSFFYVLTIRYNVKQQKLIRYIEPWMHVTAIGFPASTAFFGWYFDLLHHADLFPGCWITNSETSTSNVSWLLGSSFYFFMLTATLTNSFLVYAHVRKITGKATWKPRNESNNNNNNNNSNSGDGSVFDFDSQQGIGNRSQHQQPQQSRNSIRRRYSTGTTTSYTGSMDGGDTQRRRLGQVVQQGFLYVGVGFVSYTPLFYTQILEIVGYTYMDSADVYYAMIIQAIVTPLAGLLHATIYFRPSYMSARYSSSSGIVRRTRLEAFRFAVLGSDASSYQQQQQQQQQRRFSVSAHYHQQQGETSFHQRRESVEAPF